MKQSNRTVANAKEQENPQGNQLEFTERVTRIVGKVRKIKNDSLISVHEGENSSTFIKFERGNKLWRVFIEPTDKGKAMIIWDKSTGNRIPLSESGVYAKLWEIACLKIESMEKEQAHHEAEKERYATYDSPAYLLSEWMSLVAEGKTRLGYYEWALHESEHSMPF